MPSLSLLLHAHPALAGWTVLLALGVATAVTLGRRPVVARVVAVWALGALSVVAVAPPRGGPVAGLARTCDLRAEHLLWPWDWGRQDPRMGTIALMLVVGVLVCRRTGLAVAAAAAPAVLEVVQYAVPSLARACSVPDVLHLWMALGVGLGAGGLVRVIGGRVRGRAARVVATLSAVSVVATLLAGWALQGEPTVDPHARVSLAGDGVHRLARDGVGADDGPARPDAGTVPGAGTPYEAMARTAWEDVRLLTAGLDEDGGLPHAGPAGSWDYFWPRDGAFLAVALVATDHVEPAVTLLSRVSDLYLDPMYGFDARYLLSGGRVTLDPRRAQVDGCGWMLWAIHETARSAVVPAEVDDLRDRCTDQLLRATGGGSHLPAPGQDYWEQTTYEHLLGASAPVAAGLRFAAADYRTLGERERAGHVEDAADGVRSEIARFFGPAYLRAGTHGGLDAATAMLMPPFDPEPLPGVRQAWLGYQQHATRPAGGLAPGSGWKQDGISWTPQVALVAYTAAAAGEDEIARRWLSWLDGHRAPWGSLPEKVDAEGGPGGPAPLGWTAALVLLTLDQLDDRASGGRSGLE